MSFLIFMCTIGIFVILQSAIPYLLHKNNVFGVTIPEGFTTDSTILFYKRLYTRIMVFLGIISLFAFVIMNYTNPLSEQQIVAVGLAIMFGLLSLNMILYLIFHLKTAKRKRNEQWIVGLKQLKVANLSSHQTDDLLPTYFFLLPMFITAVVVGYTALQYEMIPSQVPYHWGISGEADAFTTKSLFSVHIMSLLLLITQIMFLFFNFFIKRSGIKLSATKSKLSQIQQAASRKYTSWLLFFISILMTALFTFFQLTTIHGNLATSGFMLTIPIIFLTLILLSTILYAFKVGQKGSRFRTTINEELVDGITDADEDRFWKAGVLYVNRNDPSMFVEKRFGVGWTINFARPLAYLIVFGPVLLILLLTFYL